MTEPWLRYSSVVLDAAARRGLHRPVGPPDDWTPPQAEAVVEVLNPPLDDMCSKYADALLQTGRKVLLVEAQWPGSGGDDLRRPSSLDQASARTGVGRLRRTQFQGEHRKTPTRCN